MKNIIGIGVLMNFNYSLDVLNSKKIAEDSELNPKS